MKHINKILSILAAVSVALAACNPTQQPDPKPEPYPSDTIGTTAETAFSVAQAIAKAETIGSTASSTTYFIKGYVVGVSEDEIAKYGNINVYLADSAFETNKSKEFTGYQVKSLGGAACEAGDVQKGDLIVICGPIIYDAKYGAGTTCNGAAYIYSINGETERPAVEYKPIAITVSNITSSTAYVSCNPGTSTALYYFNVAEKAEWDSYTDKNEYLTNLIDLFKNHYAMLGLDFDFKLYMSSLGPDRYNFEDLSPETEHVAFAVYCDATGKALSQFYVKEFTTDAEETSDEFPTELKEDFAFTPATVNVTYWGSCYAEDGVDETSFDVFIQDIEGNGVMLEAMAAPGVSVIDGTYTVDLTYQYSAGTLIPGWLYDGNAYSSWLFQGDLFVASITGGTFTIATNSDKATVNVALEDIKGHKITAAGSDLAYTLEDNSTELVSVNSTKSGRSAKVMHDGSASVFADRSSIKTHRDIRQ